MKGILLFNSQTSPTSTVHAIPTTSLVTVVLLAWYVRRVIPVWRSLRGPSQVGALLDDFPNILTRATNFDNQLTLDAFAVTPQDGNYSNILALSVRQLFGNIEFTTGWDGVTGQNDTMAFLRGTWFVSVESLNTS